MKNKKAIGLIICIVVILIIAIPIGMKKFNITTNNSNKNQVTDNNNGNNQEGQGGNSDDGSGVSGGGNDGSGGSGSNGGGTGGNGSGGGSNGNGGTEIPDNGNYQAPDENIAILKVKGYDGVYIEDGSDKEVSGVAAIQVKNNSNQAIEYGEIVLQNGSQKLTFTVSTLPAKASVVVMEKDKKKLNSSSVNYVDSKIAYVDKLEKDSSVAYSTVENNGIKLTNKSSKNIKTVRVFYKYKSDEGYYIGGITYTAKVENLKAGESTTVYPSHYVAEGGEIMMVKTYNE